MGRDKRASSDAVRITTAATSPQADLKARQRRYLYSMSLRTICFVGAILVGPGWFRWVLVAGAIVLPYIAVVMANAVASKSDDFALQDDLTQRPQLTSGTESVRGPGQSTG
ncbi:DUF3099 domain-containing protein [Nocardioides sp. GCM10027113]|uniref:DUF3099 domain-containing protein n=1 Tax=unclassified Nocardioides TaxID=2615069 RepID=UPI0036094140